MTFYSTNLYRKSMTTSYAYHLLPFFKIHNFHLKIKVKQKIDFSTSFLAFKNLPSSIIRCKTLKFLF